MTTSSRLLRLLSLLQTPRDWTGTELASRLEVSPRTVAKHIQHIHAKLGVSSRAQAVATAWAAASGTVPPSA